MVTNGKDGSGYISVMAGRIHKVLAALSLGSAGLVALPQVQTHAQVTVQDRRGLALEQTLSQIAAQSRSRVGIAAIDLDGGGQAFVNPDMPFPMASTAKVAVAATFLQGVQDGRFRLDQPLPMMMAVPEPVSARGAEAKVRPGPVMGAQALMELMITRSNNNATDGLLAAVGGPAAVNRWLGRTGITGQRLDHTMATLVRDDGKVDPGRVIDTRTSSTPRAMVSLLAAIDRGGALSAQSRAVLLDTMTRTSTGKNRMRAGLPEGTLFAHKTGTLRGVTADVGIIRLTDGRHVALAVFTAGSEPHATQAALIARVARAAYDGFSQPVAGPNLDLARR